MDVIWSKRFRIFRSADAVPLPRTVAEEKTETTKYHYRGIERTMPYSVFQFTFSGYGIFSDGNREYKITPGCGFLCNINDPETAYYYRDESGKPWQFIFLSFSNSHSLTKDISSRFGPVFKLENDSEAITRMKSFRRMKNNEIELTPGQGMNLVTSLLSALMDSASPKNTNTVSARLAKEAQEVIADNIEANLSVKDLAGILNISHEHFSRIFKSETGTSPSEYINREKIRHACILLKNTQMSCKETAFQMGYDTSSHFARTFKRYTGVTPSQYRKSGPPVPL